MIKDLLILGAAGDSHNISDIVVSINERKETWNLLGFLDDDTEKQGLLINGFPVLGPLTDFKEYPDCYFTGTFGTVKRNLNKKQVIKRLGIPHERYASLIHPRATVSPSAKIGRGTVIYSEVFVGSNAVIGDHVKILGQCNIGHDAVIGDFVTMSSLTLVLGKTNVGESCYLGGGSHIKDHLNIGKGALIGLGAVIIKDVAPYNIVVGNPGRIIGALNPDDFKVEGD